MRITTGLEVVKERVNNVNHQNNIQDAIDYILYLEEQLDKIVNLDFELDTMEWTSPQSRALRYHKEMLKILNEVD